MTVFAFGLETRIDQCRQSHARLDRGSDNPQKNEKQINKVFEKLFNPKKWPPKH